MKSNFAKLIELIAIVGVLLVGLVAGVIFNAELTEKWSALFLQINAGSGLVLGDATEAGDIASYLELPMMEERLPLVFSDTLVESQVQQQLKRGAVVLPLGVDFGEEGNVVITAHSSGFVNMGRYRFAFAKLAQLEEGQQFKVVSEKEHYVYEVFEKEIVWPSEVDKLPNDSDSTVTLVTCWPLGTDFKRLLVKAKLRRIEFGR